MYNVSLIVLTYNQDFKKLRMTLNSILIQEGIRFEIIVSDDCSDIDCSEQIISYFKNKGFLDYKININKHNLGIIGNTLQAITLANADVVKLISPGDYLSDKNILRRWFALMKNKNAKIAFGDTVYYCMVDNQIVFPQNIAMPQNYEIYNGDKKDEKIFSYIGLCDQIHGAAIMVDKSVLKIYLEKIHAMGMKWCEDVFVYLAILDDVVLAYIPETVIWYEYCCGISSNNNVSGMNKLKADMDMLYAYLEKRFAVDSSLDDLKKVVKYHSMSKLKKICFFFYHFRFFFVFLKYRVRLRMKMRMTQIPSDNSWFYKLLNY